jgi:O-antigen/teichoic acid export membrane protein
VKTSLLSFQPDRGVTKNAAALFVGRTLMMASSFVLVLYAARVLGLTGFGRYALARMYFDLLLTLGVTGLSILLTREIAKQPSQGPIYLGTAAPLGIGVIGIASGLLFMVSPAMGYGPEIRSMLWLACVALVPASFAMLSEAVFVAIGRSHYVMFGACGEALLYASTGLLLLSLGYGGQSLLVALLATRGLLAAFYARMLWRRFGEAPRPGSYAFAKQLCRDWRTFALENWLANLTASSPAIVLSVFHREAAVGLYAAASRIVSFGTPLVTSFTSAMFPYMSRLYQESRRALRQVGEESLKYMLAAAVPGVVIVAIFADRIIGTLYGEAYAGAVPVLRIAIWVFLFNFVNPFVSHILFARGEQAVSLRVGAVTSVVSLALSLVLIPRWGAIGAASTFLASGALACCLFCAGAFRPEPTRVLMTFGKAGLAAASLAGFLSIGRHAHPVAVMIGAVGLYVAVVHLLRISSARELGAILRASIPPSRPVAASRLSFVDGSACSGRPPQCIEGRGVQ